MTSPGASAISQSMTPAQWAALLFLSVLWGGSFFFNAVAVSELPPVTVVALRLIMAAAVLAVIVRATGIRLPRDPRTWGQFAVLGIFNNAVPFTVFVWAQTHITAGLASILNATQPLFTVFLAQALTHDEKITPGRVAGAVVGIAGVAALIGADAAGGLDDNVIAEVACLGATLFYAYTAVFARRFSAMGIAPLAVATGQLTTGGLVMIPIALIIDQPWTLPMPSSAVIAAVLGQALLSTVLAYVIFFHLIARAGSTNAGLVTFLNPVTAIVLGALFLGQGLAPSHVAGMAVIALGLALIDGRPVAALRRLTSR